MEDRASHHVAAFHLDTAVLITRQLAPDTDLLALHRRAPQRYPVLLESVAHGTAQARWDLLLVADGEGFSLDTDGVVRDTRGDALEGGFLGVLDRHWQTLRQPREELRWPFRGGWALFLGYELGAQIEPVLRLPLAADGLPVAQALRCPAALLRDHATGECIAVAETAHGGLLDIIEADLSRAALPALPAWVPPAALDEDAPGAFLDGVRRILDYLAAGDVFQVVPSHRFSVPFELPPFSLYRALRRLGDDYQQRWGQRVVAVETFVDPARHRGTCYVAGGFERLGTTVGSPHDGGSRMSLRSESDPPYQSLSTRPTVVAWLVSVNEA